MKEIIKKDILNLLENSINALKKDKLLKLRLISNQVIHNVSIFQDKDSISTAILIYTISKIYKEKNDINELVLPYLKELKRSLKKNNYDLYRKKIKELLNKMKKYSKTKYYISEILQQAHVNKASKMYDHGISLSRVSETLGVSMWELMEYIGETSIPDTYEYETNIKNKIEFTRKIFQT